MRIEIGANEAGQRTDKFMRKVLGDVPLSRIYKAFRKGDIRVNGNKIKEKHSLVQGDIVETKYITSEFKKQEFKRIDNKLKITFEDANILMVEKWPGVFSSC